MRPPAKPLPGNDALMDEAPTPAPQPASQAASALPPVQPLPRVHVLKPGPLNITYTTTRVLPAALARLQRTHGVVRADRSELSEVFRRLRSQLLQRLQADGQSLLAITSPRALQGKSLTAVNLALALAAELDRTVLLVDADLSGQGLQALFGLEGSAGLGEHLSQGTPIPGLLVNPGLPRFVLLPSGAVGRQASAELLGTRAARQLMQELKQRYPDRIVIVDLPPLLDSADALSFLPLADTTLLVVEEHGTSLSDMESANELLAPFNLVGAVMTQPQPKLKAARRGFWSRWRRKGKPATKPGDKAAETR